MNKPPPMSAASRHVHAWPVSPCGSESPRSVYRTAAAIEGDDTPTLVSNGIGDQVTRSTGSWIADGFSVGDPVLLMGSDGRVVRRYIAYLSELVLTATDIEEPLPLPLVPIWRTLLALLLLDGDGD